MRNKIPITTLVFILLVCAISSFSIAQDADVTPGNRRFLLLDSRIIASTENAKLEVGKVEKHTANPLFEEDKLWEMRFDNLYGNVIYDDIL